MAVSGHAWVLTEPGAPLVRETREWGDPPDGFALVEVHGCGVCHTDLGFADGHVRTNAGAPIVLGHEIVGRVLSVDPAFGALEGRRVLAPAVSPCAGCASCARGRPTACGKSRMPGNDGDGGFATHCFVPARDLFALDATPGLDGPLGSAGLEAWEIAPVADAATTAWQAIVRAGLREGDVAVFVGAGGVGGFGIQLAHAERAHVVAIDVDARRLEGLSGRIDLPIDATDLDARAIKGVLRDHVKSRGLGDATVRVFETSGTTAGQEVAFSLLSRGGSLSVVGFTPDKLPLRFSNVMALDADVHGNWGCDPALYGGVLERVLDGRVAVRPFVERRSLEDVDQVLAQMRGHALSKRAVLVPGPPHGGTNG